MFKKHYNKYIVAVVLMAVAAVWTPVRGQDIPTPMQPARLVNDFAGLFTASQIQTLEDSLVAFDRATSTQIAVVTVASLNGYDVSDFATRLLTQWGVGRKGKDNGVVLLIKPRNDEGAGKVFIATGYGVEGALPDITAGRIIDNRMMDGLREGDYYKASEAGVKGIMEAVRGEFAGEPEDSELNGAELAKFVGSIFIMLLLIIFISRIGSKGGGNNNGGRGSGGRRSVFIPPIIMGGGRSSGGGFGSGGFGGFGGGMGGGGGAGRSF